VLLKWNRALLLVGLTAIIGAASCSAGPQLKPFDDDEDRPPIIVKNGTLEFLALPIKDGPGYWYPPDSVTGPWQLKHDKNNKDGKHFNVALLFGVTECVDGRGNPVADREFKNVDSIEYIDNAGEKSTMAIVKIGGDPKTVQVSNSANSGKVAGPLLTVGSATTFLKTMDIKKNGNRQALCTFMDYLAAAVVFQKTQ